MEAEDRSSMTTDYPTQYIDKFLAAADPLTSPAVLRFIYAENSSELNQSLAKNPSLPQEIIEAMISGYGYSHMWLLPNPLLTFKQAREITMSMVDGCQKQLEACETITDMFDFLVNAGGFEGRTDGFASLLLCSPLVSENDFLRRVEMYEEELIHSIIFADSRYDVNSMDITLVEGIDDFEAM